MALIAGATHILQWSRQRVAKWQHGANPIKRLLSGDWGLQLAPMNVELVVIANQHVAVNTFSGLVHTARQVSKVVYTLKAIVWSQGRDSDKH